MAKKSFLLLLHAHIPYVLYTEAEYWLYEAVFESYLPFIAMLQKFEQENKNLCITINLSPILLNQLNTDRFRSGFEAYLKTRIAILSTKQTSPNKKKILTQDLLSLEYLISVFRFFNSEIIDAFEYFRKKKYLNIITSAVTHPFFPAIRKHMHIIDLQISVGKSISEHFFSDISGFWSPECAVFPDLPQILKKHEISYFFADASCLQSRNYFINNKNIYEHAGVRYVTRDFDSTMKIWDAKKGYPSHQFYRDFHSDIVEESKAVQEILSKNKLLKSGISLYAITDLMTNNKHIYNHEKANQQILNDAHDYYLHVAQVLENKDHCVVFFDMELFGHWWKEGINFLSCFFEEALHNNINISFDFTQKSIPSEPQLSTWGTNNNAESWINNKTAYLWENLTEKSIIFDKCISENGIGYLDQIYYFLLSQASDWPFLITQDSFVDFSKNMVLDNLYPQKIKIKNCDLFYQILKKELIKLMIFFIMINLGDNFL